MLEVQKYLQTKSLIDLTNEFGIEVKEHEVLPLVILNYSQIESPKNSQIVRECRSLTLDKRDWSIAAKSFTRFFNWGEFPDEMKEFDFSNFVVQSKEDGSLIAIYYFDNEWRVNTRSTFGDSLMAHQQFTWQEGVCKAIGISNLQELDFSLDRSFTYVCEFVSPWNKIVRKYTEPKVYLLSIFQGERELSVTEADKLTPVEFLRPSRYEFKSIEEIEKFLHQLESVDPTFEGVVIQDDKFQRWKIKSPCYLALHRMRGNDNIFNPKNLLPFVLSGEQDELLIYFPEVTEAFNDCKTKVDLAFDTLKNIWESTYTIPDQKTFALAILKKTPFTGMLFTLRKSFGLNQNEQQLKELWRSSGDDILKVLFKNKNTD